jgi:tetratricopeptide (TPR) repeat protein
MRALAGLAGPSLAARGRGAWVSCVLSSLLAAAPAAAADTRQWVLARSPGFIVISDAGEKKAQQVAHQFEQVRGLFREILQARVDPGRLVIVFAVKDEAGLRELLPAFWERKGGMRPAGVFIAGRDKHLVALRLDAGYEDSFHVPYHEYTHLLTQLNVRWVPLWLREGLAEFYASSEIDEKEVRWGLISQNHVMFLRRAPLLKLDELLAADASSPLYNEGTRVGAFYAQSAVLTHYLLLGAPKRRGQIQEFFKLLEGDVPEPEALRRAFGDLGKLESELAAYARHMSFPGVKTEVRIDPQQIQVVPLGPAEAEALRGDFLARTGRPREARALLESALRQDPQLSWAHEGLGVVEWGRGRSEDALRHFTEAARLSPRNYLAQFWAGLVVDPNADPRADSARREQALRRASEGNPGFAPALAALARLLAEQEERRAEAVSLAERATALEPAAASHRVVLWQALRRAGRTADAARTEEALLKIARRDPAVLTDVVHELDDIGRAPDAETLLRRAREASPRNAMFTAMLADFLDRQGQMGEAEKVLREALAADPQSEFLMGNLAWVLSEAPRTAAEGLAMIERTLKKSPDNPALLDTKGWALFNLHRVAEAESVLRSAVEGREGAVILEHLGDVVSEQGRAAEALALYERALDAPDLTVRSRASLQAKIDRARRPTASPAP